MVDSLRAHEGGFVDGPGGTLTFGRVLPWPERVGVVMDGGCASSCEQFILAARQSGKVTLFGSHTAGVLDHANVARADVPGHAIRLQYPTSRSMRLPGDPVDPDGIPSEVALPDTARRPLDRVRRPLEETGDTEEDPMAGR